MDESLAFLENLIPEYEKKVMQSALDKMLIDLSSESIEEQFNRFIAASGFHVIELLKKKLEDSPEDWSDYEEMGGWFASRECEIIYFWELFRNKFNE